MSQELLKSYHIDIQLPLETGELIDEAARKVGLSRDEFIIEALKDKAIQALRVERITSLTPKDLEIMTSSYLEGEVFPPTDYLKELAKKYSEMVEGA